MLKLNDKSKSKLSALLQKLRRKKIIVFESVPDFSDNTRAVFDEMIRRGYDKKYTLVWELGDRNSDTSKYDSFGCKYILKYFESKIEKRKHFYYTAAASLFLSCNRFMIVQNADTQNYMHLAHGCALKKTKHYYIPDYLKNAKVLTLSDFFVEYDAENLGCDEGQLLPLGYPRCDELFGKKADLKKLFDSYSFDKAVYWLPTYRQHIGGVFVHSDISFPIIYSDELAMSVNEHCKANRVLIIVKPHPAQDLSVINKLKLSNIIFIDNEFLNQNSISNYQLLASCDAMISDYSSVYYDYLLCNKPIGLCFDDFEEYNKREGFTVNPDYILKGGVKLYNCDDLCCFVSDIAESKDTLRDERNEISDIVHKYKDSNSAKRVVDYIEEKYLN